MAHYFITLLLDIGKLILALLPAVCPTDLWHSYSLTAIMARYFITLLLDIGTFHTMKHMRLSFIGRIEYLKWLMPWSRHKKVNKKCNHPNEGHQDRRHTRNTKRFTRQSYLTHTFGMVIWAHDVIRKKCAKIRYEPRIFQWANSPVRPAVCANEVSSDANARDYHSLVFALYGVLPE